MIGKIQLVCVKHADTFQGNIYEAHVRCDAMADGKALVSLIENRESISGIEFVGFVFADVCRSELGEFVISKDMFLSLRMDGEPIDCMEAIVWDINNLIR